MSTCPNPFQQQPLERVQTMFRVEPSEPVPSPFAIGELFQDAWDIGIKCWKPFLIMGLIVGGIIFIAMFSFYVCTFIAIIPLIVMEQPPDIGIAIAIVGILLTIALVLSLVMVWIYSGEVAYSLAVVRGEQPPVAVLFSGMKHFWGILIAGANITVIILCIGFVIFMITSVPAFLYLVSNPVPNLASFIILGVIAMLGYTMMMLAALFLNVIFFLTYFFVVDRQQGPIEAMKSSCRFVWAQFWRVLGSVLLISVCLIVSSSIPLVGMFLYVPVAMCLYTVLYLKITGQRHGLITSYYPRPNPRPEREGAADGFTGGFTPTAPNS